MYAARYKITDLEAQNATLTKKVEDVEADKKRVEGQGFACQRCGDCGVETQTARTN
ncbi:hypothetical protein Hanom_Chr11g01036631 [Helianthus anomalus]